LFFHRDHNAAHPLSGLALQTRNDLPMQHRITMSSEASHGDWDHIACPVCGGDGFFHLFDKGGEAFVRCLDCGLTLINPRPPFARIRDHYDAAYSAGYTQKANAKIIRARRRVARIGRAGGRWLDVGCSAGFVVKAALEAGFEAWGVDIEADGINYGRETLGLARLACGVLEDQHYPDRHFDVISAYDVIEHVPDLNRFVAELARILAPHGVLDIGTPDIGHWRVPRALAQWNELKPSEHLYYFNRQTLGRLLARHGLQIVRKRLALKPGLKVLVAHA
jgi:2-polyprenyl-3-methyl-5-hydroxy-6-metoxy-1,4-benzoquinol methylase